MAMAGRVAHSRELLLRAEEMLRRLGGGGDEGGRSADEPGVGPSGQPRGGGNGDHGGSLLPGQGASPQVLHGGPRSSNGARAPTASSHHFDWSDGAQYHSLGPKASLRLQPQFGRGEGQRQGRATGGGSPLALGPFTNGQGVDLASLLASSAGPGLSLTDSRQWQERQRGLSEGGLVPISLTDSQLQWDDGQRGLSEGGPVPPPWWDPGLRLPSVRPLGASNVMSFALGSAKGMELD